MSTTLTELAEWVDSVARRTRPDKIHWCTGSAEENTSLINGMLDTGDLLELNQESHPECYLHRSDPDDVARVEHLTYVCTREREARQTPWGGCPNPTPFQRQGFRASPISKPCCRSTNATGWPNSTKSRSTWRTSNPECPMRSPSACASCGLDWKTAKRVVLARARTPPRRPPGRANHPGRPIPPAGLQYLSPAEAARNRLPAVQAAIETPVAR